MALLKNYAGSVYGGLGHLLKLYCESQQLPEPQSLLEVQNLERFDYVIWRDLLEQIEHVQPHIGLGLKIAEYVQPKHLGILAYIALSCESLGEALNRYQDFHRLVYDGSPLKVEFLSSYFSIRWEETELHPTQLTDEIAIALMVQFLQQFMCKDQIHLHEVHFINPPPKEVQVYERYFHCRVKFSQEKTQILIPMSEASKVIGRADHTLQQLLMQQAQALLQQLPHTTQLDQRLQQAILKGLQKNEYQIEQIAAQLGLSVRQLQRHLQQQNMTFQQRTQQIRYMLAIEYLKDPHLSLQEIALLLCYSEQSAFQRAFKQWSQMTPQQWRQQYVHH
ncbi:MULTISPECIES: AraC family transcriptional regulator [unclassified Acinetobacter]|uniref:AraC family transcriptional regulator n=1 Tax=unclassified Acinetobacter TaxID=196816 RepID=UPI00190D6B04|nr:MULTISPECIES: AraC family transcriptional regulator [unclassified Acinetobacter]MBK0063434.1 AraC family transcriptional regulator ligand-binding domain-containing protein [Acinetobacter sp. S55]MBK0065495.1 AraC family transcriptional regulator ligand-binding domain-containing protein [Acinetobacter sp. S54]